MSKDRYNVTNLPAPFDVSCDVKSVMLPMRDGVKLHTLIFFPPETTGRVPVILFRTPYSQRTFFDLPNAVALKNKCAFIMQACRGTGWSEGGVFHPSDDEIEKNDAEDLFAWLEEQSWFNGRCVMLGASYPGWTQWCAMRSKNRCLVGTSPRVAPLYSCCGAAKPDGGMAFSFPVNWPLAMYHRHTYGYEGVPNFVDDLGACWHMPIIDADKFVYDKELPIYRDFIAVVAAPEPFLKKHLTYFDSIKVPAFISGGWFDGFKMEVLESFQMMKQHAATAEARNFTRLTIGPWGHGGLLNPEIFGEENDYRDLLPREEKFLISLLADPAADPLPGETAVKFFMLCENRWYDTSAWPPPGNETQVFYLHSGGNANSLDGDGTISRLIPQDELPDSYISDPAAPVSPSGGKHSGPVFYDRSFLEKRRDVLVYTSEIFTEPLTVTGNIKLRFSASATTPDTDFFATLTYLTPDGKSMILTTGMIRARYRNSLAQEELLIPGKIYDYEIDLGDIAVKFMPGYAVRLEIHGQEFPARGRNNNTGNPVLTDTEMRCSTCTIYHNTSHPAELLLPVNNNF